MKEWVLFVLFFLVGLGLLIAGIVYIRREKDDAESVKIYRVVALIGAVLCAAALLIRFVL